MSSTVDAIPPTLLSDNNGEMTSETTNAAIGKDEGQEGKQKKKKKKILFFQLLRNFPHRRNIQQ